MKRQASMEQKAPREAVVLEKGQYYWVETDSGEYYAPCKLLYNVKDTTQELTFEVYGTRAVLQAAQHAVTGMIPPPATLTLEKNFNDLVAAVDISEPAILWNLKMRFKRNEIYSGIGPILIAVNPYKMIDNMYSPENLVKYLHVEPGGSSGGDGGSSDSLNRAGEEPHIWSIARSSYLQLRHSGTRQAIIVSGESGAGKTEATKQCLQFLSSISLSADHHQSRDAIEERVLDTNPLLESFGNAKTARNNNSSRFGKWLEIKFKRSSGVREFHMELVGARITQYLLEKSRVVAQAKDERNYHIFYQMCTYADFDLGNAENFNFLCLSGATVIPGVDDAADFLETLKSFDDLKFGSEDRAVIFDSLRAILHLGNITFENGDTAQVPSTGVARMSLSEASSLLRMDLRSLESALTQRTLEIRGERMHVPNSESAASDDRNALCKEIYGRLFCQIVQQANASLSMSSSANAAAADPAAACIDSEGLSIGLLDIFGFEIFIQNSFEQLCINYANEKLQQYFIEFVLKKEQDVYDAEGIMFERVTPMDNLDVLSMIESRQGGIFVLLDEELKVPKGSDLSFLKKVETQQTGKSGGRFRRDFRGPQEVFEIQHFAGTVAYTVTNFMEKNRDKMHDHLEDLLQMSGSSRFRDTMSAHGPNGGAAISGGGPMSSPVPASKAKAKSSGGQTIVSRFSKQLLDLMGMLSSSQPHFVKCVKPNNTKSPSVIDTDLVLRQLRYSGVLEAVKIRKSGYPVRMALLEFVRCYRVISGLRAKRFHGLDERKACELIISQLAARGDVYESVKLGRTLVFYRPESSNAMEAERFQMADKALIYLQARRRMHICAARVKLLCNARASLRAVMKIGQSEGSCNTAAIPMLEKEIAACEDLRLMCFVLRDGKKLLDRLRRVLACKERMTELVAAYDNFTDIIEYHDDMKACLDAAAEFGIKSPVIAQAKSQMDDIRERVDALMALREAMKIQDDELLEKCMQGVAKLSQKYGTYCASEATHAGQLLADIKIQLNEFDEALSTITSLHRSVGNSSESCMGKVERDNPLLQDKVSALKKHKLNSVAGSAIMEILQGLFDIRCSWIQRDWSAVASQMKQLHKACESTACTEMAKLSPANRSRIASWQRAATNEVDLLVVEMDLHYFLPKIMAVWQHPDGTPKEAKIGEEELQYQQLRTVMDEVKSVGWLGSNLTAMFPLFDTALDMKKAQTLDEPEVLLAITEGAPTTAQRLQKRNELVGIFNSEELMEDFSAIQVDVKSSNSQPPPKANRRTSIHFGSVIESGTNPSPPTESPVMSRRHTMDTKTSTDLTVIIEEPAEDIMAECQEYSPSTMSSPGGSLLKGMFRAVDDATGRPSPPPPPTPRGSLGADRGPPTTPRRPSVGPGLPPPPPPPTRRGSSGSDGAPPPPPSPHRPTAGPGLPPPPPPRRSSTGPDGAAPLPPPPPPPVGAAGGDRTQAPPPPPPPHHAISAEAAANKPKSPMPPPPPSKAPQLGFKLVSPEEHHSLKQIPRASDIKGQKNAIVPKTRIPFYPPVDNEHLKHRKTLQDVDELVRSLSGRFRDAALVIKADIVRTRHLSMERYSQMLLTEAIQFGAIQGNIGKLRLEKGSVMGLSKTIKEVDELLKDRESEDPFTEHIRAACANLLFLRKSILESSFEAIVKMHSKHQLDISVPKGVPQSRIQLIFFQMVRAEIAVIVSEASNEWFSRKLSSVLQIGSIKGDVGKVKLKEIGFKEIEETVDMIHKSKQSQGEHGVYAESMQTLIDFSNALVELRKAFQAGSYEKEKAAYADLLQYASACPPIALKELSFIKKNMVYEESLHKLTVSLSMPSDFSYFLGRQSPAPGPSAFPKASEGDEAYVKNRLNPSSVATAPLSAAIDMGDVVILDVGVNSLPQYFQHIMKAARSILRLRQSIAADKWEEADDILNFLREKQVLSIVPILQNEFHAAVEAVDAELVITVCQTALSSSGIRADAMDKSEFDTSHTSTERLDKAVEICMSRGCRTKASTVLFRAANLIRELRRAAVSSDWGTLKSVLQKSRQDKTTAGFPKCSIDELMVAETVILNEEHTGQLMTSLQKETIHLHYGKLPEARFISSTSVKIALKDAQEFDRERRGQRLDVLIDMAEHAMQCREGLKADTWRSVVGSISGFLRTIRQYKELVLKASEKKSASSGSKAPPEGGSRHVRRGSIGAAAAEHEVSAENSFIAIMESEHALLTDYISMHRLEADAILALAEGGMKEECVGCVENAAITVTAINDVLDQLSQLQDTSALSLLRSLSDIAIGLNLIRDIRVAVVEGSWKRVREIMNEATSEATFDSLPEPSRREITAVKLEMDNREMIANLTQALSIGRLTGEVGNVDLTLVSCKVLDAAIKDCKAMVIRTEEAGCLMYSAMQVLRLRQYVREHPTPWSKVKVYANGLLTGQQLSKLHPSTVPEIRLIHAVVVDNVLCKSLSDALTSGNPSGPPGKMDRSNVSVAALETACHEAVLAVNRTEKAEQLLRSCKQFLRLRELLMHLAPKSSDSKSHWDAWSSISTIISEMVEISKKNPLDAGWMACRSVVSSISKEVLIQECASSLQESVDAATMAYSNMGKISFGTEEEIAETTERVETRSLDQIIEHCSEYPESTSLYLDQLLSAVASLRQLRAMLNAREWGKVKKYARNRDLPAIYQNCSFCLHEVKCAYQEAHNAEIIETIVSVLRRPYRCALSLSNEEVEEALVSETMLDDVLRRAEAAGVTTVAAQQLVQSAERMLHLRVSMRDYDAPAVHKELRWFQANGHVCAKVILAEVKVSDRLFRNAMAIKKIVSALSTGSATRRTGVLDMASVNTEVITEALDEAKQIADATEDLAIMIYIGELIYGLRYAQKFQTEDDVKIAVDNIMASHIALHSCAVEEVSEARADVGNKAAVATLTNALKAFKPAASMVPSSGETNSMLTSDVAPFETAQYGSSPMQPLTNKMKSSLSSPYPVTPRGTKKSFFKQHSRSVNLADIDPSSALALEIALEQAETHGIFSIEARRLKKTTLFVLSLRHAIEADDWFRVEEILAEHDKKSMTRRKSYIQLGDVASVELLYVRLQLRVMSSLVELGKNLKTGWANCSNGIVDVTRLIVDPLLEAILRTERSILDFDELKSGEGTEEGAGVGAIEKESVRRLLKSAHDILKIRKCLHGGEISAAASQAEKVLQSKPHAIVHAELQLYYVEIGRALHMMRLCRSLRGSMRLGNVEALEATIFEAQQASMQLSGDLGLVRTLEKAVELYRSIIQAHSYLRSVAMGYDITKIEGALEQSIQLHMSGALIDKVKIRLNLMKKFEANITTLTSSLNFRTNPVQIQEVVVQLATADGLDGHPIARRAATLLRLSRDSLRTALLGEAAYAGNKHLASCETMSVRRHYLTRSGMAEALRMQNFSGYRDPENFATRMMLDAQELSVNMLQHAEGPIATSLTRLNPVLAALAVWIFRHCIRAIEEQEYSHPEVILRNLISLGRFSIPMRDEIFAQLIKQLTENPEEDNRSRLWPVLAACLDHFPPSKEFDPFVEHFLIRELDNTSTTGQVDAQKMVQHCLSALHEAVFRYGYARKISSSWDASLKHMLSLLTLKGREMAAGGNDSSIQYSALVQQAAGTNTRRRSMAMELTRQNTGGISGTSMDQRVPFGSPAAKSKKHLHSASEDLSWEDSFSPPNTKQLLAGGSAKKAQRRSSAIDMSPAGKTSFGPDGSISLDFRLRGEPSFDFGDRSNGAAMRSMLSRDSFSDSFMQCSEAVAASIVSDRKLRGTVDNWMARFSMLSDGQYSISFECFAMKFRNNYIDQRDKDVFMFLIFGAMPKVTRPATDKILASLDAETRTEVAVYRQQLILKQCESIETVNRNATYETSMTRFWDRFVVPFLTEKDSRDSRSDVDDVIDHSGSEESDVFSDDRLTAAKPVVKKDMLSQPGDFDWVLYRELVTAGSTYLAMKHR